MSEPEYDYASDDWFDEDDNDECWTCYGTGCVSPTNTRVSDRYLILGTETCPECGGSGFEP